jgi:uncharacterized protein (DUF2141 family)
MLTTLLLMATMVPSSPSLGIAEGRCRPNEPGPALLVNVTGFRDRQGRIKLEVYPSNNQDFLSDDNVLVNAGKTFRRIDLPLPAQGSVRLCVRVPGPGPYSLLVLHDRDGNRRFSLSGDGIGFAGNPRLGMTRPSAAQTRVVAGPRITAIDVVLNYRRGLSFRPLDAR